VYAVSLALDWLNGLPAEAIEGCTWTAVDEVEVLDWCYWPQFAVGPPDFLRRTHESVTPWSLARGTLILFAYLPVSVQPCAAKLSPNRGQAYQEIGTGAW
jgi:hypothetical protein